MRAAQQQNLPVQWQHVSSGTRELLTSGKQQQAAPVLCPHYKTPTFSSPFDPAAFSTYRSRHVPLDTNNMLLRGCVLRNTDEIIGMVRRKMVQAIAWPSAIRSQPFITHSFCLDFAPSCLASGAGGLCGP